MGFRESGDDEPADICVVNTCAVTAEAARKSRQAARKLRKFSPNAKTWIIGCAAEKPQTELANLPDEIIFVGNDEKENLAKIIAAEFPENMQPVPLTGGRIRAYLKVQDGCDSFCSYCIIPYLRGRSRSRKPQELVEELKQLEDAGYSEVVLTGIHLGDYGKHLEPRINLAGLLDQMLEATSIPRIRLSSLEPMDFSWDLPEVFKKHPRICRHLHLPLQHGSDRILKLMNRKYTLQEYDEIIRKSVEFFPEIAITTDVMVGFPGETDEDFENMENYIRTAPFFQLHCFPYSKRTGTKAASMAGIVPSGIKKDRLHRLLDLSRQKTEQFLDGYIGKEVEVLFEHFDDKGMLTGHTGNYMETAVEGGEDLRGVISTVSVTKRSGEKLYGKRTGHLCNR